MKQYIPVSKFSVRSGRFQGYLAEDKEACSRTQHSAFNEDYFAPLFRFMYCWVNFFALSPFYVFFICSRRWCIDKLGDKCKLVFFHVSFLLCCMLTSDMMILQMASYWNYLNKTWKISNNYTFISNEQYEAVLKLFLKIQYFFLLSMLTLWKLMTKVSLLYFKSFIFFSTLLKLEQKSYVNYQSK